MWCIAQKTYMWCFHWNAWAVDKKYYGNHCTVQYCTVQFCFEIKHVMALFWNQANRYACLGISECKMFVWSHAPVTFVDVLWSLFHLLKGTSVRMEHGTASSASSDAVEIRMQRHCEMMQDGVAELLSFFLPSFVKLVFCWCVQPSVCRSLRQWFFAMSNSWVVFSVWKSENKCFAVDCATLQRQA